jgi:RNA polymerase sigma factor (sigma-70 family)
MPLGHEGFESVLAAAKAGAEWAWASLFREYAGPVTGYVASRGSKEPEDLTSEIFIKVANSIHSFEGDESSFRSWIFVIAHRRLIDERRSVGRKPDFTELPPDYSSNGVAGNVETEALELLVTDELRDAFEVLTDGQRDVLALRMIAGLTLAETAEMIGKKVGAVKALQRRALEALQQEIDVQNVTPQGF